MQAKIWLSFQQTRLFFLQGEAKSAAKANCCPAPSRISAKAKIFHLATLLNLIHCTHTHTKAQNNSIAKDENETNQDYLVLL